jgi:hypothetical protein
MEAFLKGLAHTHKILYWLLQGSGPPNENIRLALSKGWPIAREILFCPAEGTSPRCEIYYGGLSKGTGPYTQNIILAFARQWPTE